MYDNLSYITSRLTVLMGHMKNDTFKRSLKTLTAELYAPNLSEVLRFCEKFDVPFDSFLWGLK